MIAPKNGTTLQAKIYDKTFEASSESMVDESVFFAQFEERSNKRSLKENEDTNELQMIGFTPSVESHEPISIKIKLSFHKPEFMAYGGNAFLSLLVEEPSVFKSAKTLKPVNA